MGDVARFRSMCGRTLAVVLARDEGAIAVAREGGGRDNAEPLVRAAVNEVCWAQVAFVFVLAAPQVGDAVTREVHLGKRSKNAPLVQVVECEESALAATWDGSDREVLHALVQASPVECDAVLVVDASEPLITADQVYDLCAAAQETPKRTKGETPFLFFLAGAANV